MHKDEYGRRTESSICVEDRIETKFATYITLPITRISMKHVKSPGFVSFRVTDIIQPSDLEPLQEESKALFQSALDTLSLQVAHTTVMIDDEFDEYGWPIHADDWEEDSSDIDGQETSFLKKQARRQHIECLECGSKVCKSQTTNLSFEPALMLLGSGTMKSL